MTAKQILDSGLYDSAVELMDADIRDDLASSLFDDVFSFDLYSMRLSFLSAYMDAHFLKYGSEFQI